MLARGSMMSDSLTKPSEVFASRVQPALDNYLAGPKDERLANNLAEAINNQVGWSFAYYLENDRSRLSGSTTPTEYRLKAFDECPATKMMWDLADANKHRFLTRQQPVPRTVTSSTAAFSIRNNELWVNEYNKAFLPEATAAMEYLKRQPD